MRGVALRVAGVRAGGAGTVALEVAAGGYGCVLGPGGAGKSLVVRTVAGLARGGGVVAVDGVEVQGMPAPRRGFALLAGSGGVFAAGSVAGCLRFAQRARGVAPARRAKGMAALLEAFELEGGADPAEAGPFEQLRIRLAAALAGEPRMLLLDDPLAGWADRQAAIDLLRQVAARHRITVLHATRVREEAFALATHLVLLETGRVLQAGAASALYDRPATLAIAHRLGPANVLAGRIEAIEEDVATVRLECGPVIEADPPDDRAGVGAACRVLLRPERVSVSPLAPAELGEGAVAAVLRELVPMGDEIRLVLALGADAEIVVTRSAAIGARGLVVGRTVSVAWRSQHALTFLA